MNETVAFAQDVTELKKLFAAGGAVAAIVVAVIAHKNIFGAILGKLPAITALADLKIPELLPEVLDVQESEAVELVHAFYSNFV